MHITRIHTKNQDFSNRYKTIAVNLSCELLYINFNSKINLQY